MSTKDFKQVALDYHRANNKPGKLSVVPSKELFNAYQLSLAYSPGVAFPCLEIDRDPELAYEYTNKMVAVISNSTAVLGLGKLSPVAGKPVMEGKCVLFKKFSGIDAVDIELDAYSIEDVVKAVKAVAPTFGGINLEDIKSPECFEIERILKEELDIPVFHDDQHGTAIITVAGLRNACEIGNKNISDLKIVMSGAGAAGIACLDLMIKAGVRQENVIVCDRTGVIYKGREEGMDDIKRRYAADTKSRTLGEAMVGADVFIGLSVKGAVSKEMVKSMAPNPIIFAMANPDPEISPEEVLEVRTDAMIATGRSDYPNQVNNVMGFPYIFRGALDVRSKEINDEMKLAAADAIAALAKKPIPHVVKRAYPDRVLEYGPGYIIPTAFDPNLIVEVSMAVAKAAIKTGVARKNIDDWDAYKKQLESYNNPSVNIAVHAYKSVKASPKRVIFSEGEELEVIRAALQFKHDGLGTPIIVGNEDKIQENAKQANISSLEGVEILNSANSPHNNQYIDTLFARTGREGFLYRDCARLVKTDRNIFAASVLKAGHADCMITGCTRGYEKNVRDIGLVLDTADEVVYGLSSLVTASGKILFVADTSINYKLSGYEMAYVAKSAADKVRSLGVEPSVAFVSYSNFGSRMSNEASEEFKTACDILESEKVDFDFDGEMTMSVASSENPSSHYSFNRLKKPANIIITQSVESAAMMVSSLKNYGGASVIGSVLHGFEKSAQIVHMGSDSSNLLSIAALGCLYV